jgi:hypothetical protein
VESSRADAAYPGTPFRCVAGVARVGMILPSPVHCTAAACVPAWSPPLRGAGCRGAGAIVVGDSMG